ncbi:MAG: type VI secretion system protein TssA [Candidatus Saccharibacteria bacterium]|nr:type VI secretion system protein TssA [Pseudorhodobacter sp.]
MDVTSLLSARDGDEPSGENLEYDFDFMQLLIAAQPGEERQVGKDIIAATEPDYKDVEQRAVAILERAHDLRAAVILGTAVLQTRGLTGFAEATAYIRGCLEQFWDTCHPQLDADDDNDPTFRINAVRGLGGSDTVLNNLRRTPLTASRTFGRASLRDIQMAYGEMPVAEGQTAQFDRTSVAAAFADSGEEVVVATLAAARSAMADVKAIEAVFSDRTPGYGPDLDELRKMLQQIVRHMSEHVTAAPEAADDVADEDTDEAPAGRAAMAPVRRGGGGPPGAGESAQDARAAIDQVIEYFKRVEPSSPVPIILDRAKRLIGADFMTILKDMAPGGLETAMMIGGISEEEDDD